MLYIDAAGTLHYDKAANFALTCPHCQVLAHLTPVSVPISTAVRARAAAASSRSAAPAAGLTGSTPNC